MGILYMKGNGLYRNKQDKAERYVLVNADGNDMPWLRYIYCATTGQYVGTVRVGSSVIHFADGRRYHVEEVI